MNDIQNPKTWKSLKVGDIISLKDEQTIADLMGNKDDRALEGIDLEIDEIKLIEIKNVDLEFLLFEFTAASLDKYQVAITLLVKIVDDKHMDVRAYFPPDDFNPDNRQSLFDEGCLWLFEEPENTDNLILSELEFADEFVNESPDGQQITFKKKGLTFFGENSEHSMVQVTEWLADTECTNPEAIAIEYGGLNSEGNLIDEGGYIVFLQGETIGNITSDIELLQQA